MAKQFCCDCEELDRKNEYSEWFSGVTKYKCRACGEYKELTEEACHKIKPIKTSGEFKQSGCYITTIVCEILGYEDNCELLTTLRDFRDNVLKVNPQYLPLLFEYDQIGPIISNEIRNEKNNYSFCLGLLKYFLIPCVHLIHSNDIDGAVAVYQNMVMHLNDSFGLPNISIVMEEDYDLETLGKGRIRTQKASEC